MRLSPQDARPEFDRKLIVFNPSQDEVRRFFCNVYARQQTGAPLTPLETIAGHWIDEHPEYHRMLGNVDAALERRFDAADGQSNPFLHLSMHLAISEQLSIDQPPGLRAHFGALSARLGSEHAAAHEVMECLGEVLWHAERNRRPPDGAAYLECVARRAGAPVR